MVTRFLLLLQYLFLFVVVPSLADDDDADYSICYFPSLNASDGFYSCNLNYYSMCCPAGAICLDTPLCLTADSQLIRGTCSDPNYADSSCPNFCTTGSFGNFLDSYADVTACNSSNLDGALSGNHDYACESDDCLGDSGELVPLGGYLSMTATWDAVNFAFTSLPTALPVLWNGAADAATGTDTIYGRLAAETPMTSASYSISTSANSYTSSTASSTSMLSYSSESPTVYTNTYTPSDTPMTSASTTSASTTSSSTTSSASETDAFANASTYMVSPASSTPDVSEHFNNGSRSGLNTPEIVGIAVGCGLAVVALILAIFCCRRRRKNRTLHNTAGSHNNPRHFGLRRESDVLETASMIAEADPAHELPVELGGTTWVEAPEKGSPPEKDKSAHESSPPDSVMDRKESKARVSHEQDSAQV